MNVYFRCYKRKLYLINRKCLLKMIDKGYNLLKHNYFL